MCASWNKEFNPDVLIKKIEQIRVKDESGALKFKALFVDNYLAALDSMLLFNNDIPALERKKIINQSLFAAARRSTLSQQSFLAELAKGEQEYLRMPKKQFVLVTTLSIRPFGSAKRITGFGETIKLRRMIPNTFEHMRAYEIMRGEITGGPPKGYSVIMVEAEGRSEYEVAHKSFRTLDLVRGVWNWCLNRHRIRHTFGRPKAVNSVLFGPVHTVHNPSGELAIEVVWYQPEYVGPVTPKNIQPKWKELRWFGRFVQRCLSKIQYRVDIEKAFRWYAQALDVSDLSVAFIKLWGVLEYLTGTLADPYKVTIKRALFPWKERDYHREILKHLRHSRNRAIHTGEELHEAEALVYQLKSYVETLLEFHLIMGPKLSSFQDAVELLDVPGELPAINKRMRIFSMAKRMVTS